MPQSNTPVTNVGGNDVRCNAGGSRGVSKKCPVKAGSTVTVEMHQVTFTLPMWGRKKKDNKL
jgi:cellulase